MLSSLLLLTTLLTACDKGTSSSAVQPTLFTYSREVQNQGAIEFEALPPACNRVEVANGCSVIRLFMLDYRTNRKEIKAIKSR